MRKTAAILLAGMLAAALAACAVQEDRKSVV